MRRLSLGTRIEISRKTGQLVVYRQTLQNYIYDHQSPPDLNTVSLQITSELGNQGYDAYCDHITLVQGVLTDTMQPSVWVATESPLDPITITAIVQIIKTAILLFITITAYYIITAVKEVIWGVPKQYYIPDPQITSPVTWEEYISYQNAHYWYVCNKDGAGFGDKALYPTINDVPQSDVQAYLDHCATAPDISPEEVTLVQVAIIVGGTIIVIGGIWLATELIKLFSKRS